jgi:hypothetical protein
MTTEEERLSSLLKQAVPEPLELSAARVTAQYVGHQPRHRSHRPWLMPTIAVTAAAAAAVAAVIVWPSSAPHPRAYPVANRAARPTVKVKPGGFIPSAVPTSAPAVTYSFSAGTTDVTAAYVLDKAATALGSQSQPEGGWPTGAYWHTLQQVRCGGGVYDDNTWIGSDGDGVGWGIGPKMTNGSKSTREEGSGCAPGGDAPFPIVTPMGGPPGPPGPSFSIGEKSYTLAQLDALPTDPAKLWPIMKADERLSFSLDPALPKSGSSDLFQSIWNLLTSEPVPAALRKALYEVSAKIPGVSVEGTYTDSLGRTGTVLHVGMWTMVVDTSNGQVLAMMVAPGPSITVCGDSGCHQQPGPGASANVYISAGWASAASVPKVPASSGSVGSGTGSAPQAVPTSSPSAASRP